MNKRCICLNILFLLSIFVQSYCFTIKTFASNKQVRLQRLRFKRQATLPYNTGPITSEEANEKIPCANLTNVCAIQETCGKKTTVEKKTKREVAKKNTTVIAKTASFGWKRMSYGRPVFANQWPYFVRILITSGSKAEVCSGALIAPNMVLTAAHCIFKKESTDLVDVSSVKVHAGLVGLNDETKSVMGVTKICYSSTNFANKDNIIQYDYALLTLDGNFAESESIRSACLPFDPIDTDNNTECHLVGAGLINDGDTETLKRADKVQTMRLKKVSCEPWGLDATDRSRFCFSKHDGKGDSCQGDSGGPVLCQNTNGQWVVVGVVSYGSQDCLGKSEQQFTGVYVNVRAVLKDILYNCQA